MTAPEFLLVENQPTLERACRDLDGASRVYLDTEFESSRAGVRLCLVQISRGQRIYLVDVRRLSVLKPLAAVLSCADTEWVLHAGEQDVSLLVQQLGTEFPFRVFDTQVVWGLVSAESSVSLAYLQFRLLGLRLPKAHQADDWTRRPLPRAQLEYAAGDIAHLPKIQAELDQRAQALDRSQIVRDASRDVVRPEPSPPPELTLASFRNAWQLDPRRQAVLRFVIDWHNSLTPRERSRAPDAKVLLSIANRLPENTNQLGRIKGIPRSWCARNGDWFVGELQRSIRDAAESDFVPVDPSPYATFEDIRLDGWLQWIRAELCAQLSVAPELALPARLLKRARDVIRQSGDALALLPHLTPWRRHLLEAAYREQCIKHPPPLPDR